MLYILDFITEHGPRNDSNISHWNLLSAYHWKSKQQQIPLKTELLNAFQFKRPKRFLFSATIFALEGISSCSISKFGYGF